MLLIALIVVWLIASSRAASDFFNAYADGARADPDLRPVEPAAGHAAAAEGRPPLHAGAVQRHAARRRRRLARALHLRGAVAPTRKGNRQTTYYHFTVAVTQLPETAPFLSELALQRRFGFRFLDSAEDVFRSRQRVEVESELADKKFEIFTGKDDEMNRARQVFTPTFVVWLGEEAHEGIAFELSAGALVVNQKGHLKTAHELDAFCEGAAVVARRVLRRSRRSSY